MLRHRSSYFILCAILFLGKSFSVHAQQLTETSPSLSAVLSPVPVQSLSTASPLAKAAELYRTGKFDSAAQEYNAILEREPNTALAYVGLVRVYLKQKKIAEAYSAATRAMELAPKLDAAHVAIGEAYFRQGKIKEAENEFATLVKAGTTDARAYLGLSRVYRAFSLYKHAKLAIDRAHVIDPADPDIQRAWLGTLSLEERIKALKAYLASKTNDDAEQRQELEKRLSSLRDEAQQGAHPCRLTTKVTEMQTKLEQLLYDPTHIRGFALSVKLNAVSSKLLLDTGAGGILINRRIAEKVGVKRVVQTDLKGVGDKGPASGYVGYVDSIKIGDIEFQDCYVGVIDKDSVIGDDGLIGADVFSDFLIHLDFPNSKFKLSQLPARPDEPAAVAALQSQPSGAAGFHDRYIAPEMTSFVPVLRFGHQLLIPTKVNDIGPKLFLIDTGAFNNTISPSAAREVTKVSSDSDTTVKGLSGSVKDVFRADQLTLQFGHFRQKNVDIVAFDTTRISDSIGTEVSGMLGFAMLRMLEIKIDYRDGLVDFVYNPARWR
jgi:tetratricopeptide (TPR) repeat protein